jgi:hypothetical protein
MSHYATMVANKAMDYAKIGFGSRFKTYRQTPMMQVQPTDLPMLGIFIMREKRSPWGNANHAEPKFQHEMTLGFSGAVHADTDDQNKFYQLEQWMSELDDILLSNPKFVILTAGVEAMDRQSQYAKVGETTLFEIRVEMVLAFQSSFPPRVVDDFNILHVETRYPSIDTDPAEVMQIVRQYDLTQNEITAALTKAGQTKAGPSKADTVRDHP